MNKPSLEGAVIFFLVATLVILNSSPLLVNGQYNAACRKDFESILAVQCLEKFGLNYHGVVFFTRKKVGEIPLPFTYNSYRNLLCSTSIQRKVVPCVYDAIHEYGGVASCSYQDIRVIIEKGMLLLKTLDDICRNPCEEKATQTITHCFTAIKMNLGTIFTQNASIFEDKFPLAGRNRQFFPIVCKNHQKLFYCLRPVSKSCPSLISRLNAVGINYLAVESVTKMICANRLNYFKGLTCFQKTVANGSTCDEKTKNNLIDSFIGHFQQGAQLPSKYIREICIEKLMLMECKIALFQTTCDAASINLWISIECMMLPPLCRMSDYLQKFDAVCRQVNDTTRIPKVITTQETRIILATETNVTLMPSFTTQVQLTEAIEPIQSTDQTQPTEDTDLVQSTGQTQPTEDMDLIQSTGQTQPTEDTDLIQSTGQTQPTENTDLIQSMGQTQPTEDTDLIQSTGQTQPTEDTELMQSMGQTQPITESTQSLAQTPWFTNNNVTGPTQTTILASPIFYCDGAASVTASMILLVNAAGIWSLL